MHIDQVEAQVAYLLQHAVKGSLIGEPTAEAGLVRPGRSHLESFERALQARADPPAQCQFVFGRFLGHDSRSGFTPSRRFSKIRVRTCQFASCSLPHQIVRPRGGPGITQIG